mmetsp:Transcript_5654/g.10723  ORF Transcript_5654/g.10723 Transcript_5654/m.10723 type:complete len:780 (+) Transcript_5654:192-2531(+)
MTTSCVEEALKNAKYNEAVVLTTTSQDLNKLTGDECEKEIILVPVIDNINGGVTWQDAASISQSDAFDIGILRHFRTKKWILPMLNDIHRNNLYETSIRAACSELIMKRNRHKMIGVGNDITFKVFDIGSGTGLLSMISSKSLKEITNENVEVIGIEMASAMARLARKTIAENNFQDSIKIIEGHSCESSITPYANGSKALLCTSELLETGLLGEGIIPALRDAWERHLEEDAIVVPQRARVYAQVLEGGVVHSFRGPHNDSTRMFQLSIGDDKKPLLGGDGIGIRVPFHADVLFEDETSEFLLGKCPTDEKYAGTFRTLSSPHLVLEFDFRSKHSIPPSSGREFPLNILASNSGVAHGVLFWWELDLWEGQTYSTKVGAVPWQDHWQQCLYVFGEEHEKCQVLEKDQAFTLFAHHDDMSISFRISVSQNLQPKVQPSKKLKAFKSSSELSEFHNSISYERALQLNDKNRMDVLHLSIEHAIRSKGKKSLILDLSDFSLCSIIAAKSFGAERVISLESSTNQLPTISAIVAQHSNHLPHENCEFQIINAYAEQLTPEILGSGVDIVMAEPYYEILEGWHLQEALNYFYLMRSLKQRGVVKSDAISVPSHAKVMVCAVQLHQSVADSYSGLLESKLCGFSHDEVSKYGNYFSSYDIKIPMFQYKWRRLSKNFCVSKIQYDGPAENMLIGSDNAKCIEVDLSEGIFHGIALWVDYHHKIEDGISEDSVRTITTGNCYNHQVFRFAKSPSSITKKGAILKLKMSFVSNDLEDHVIEMEVGAK